MTSKTGKQTITIYILRDIFIYLFIYLFTLFNVGLQVENNSTNKYQQKQIKI